MTAAIAETKPARLERTPMTRDMGSVKDWPELVPITSHRNVPPFPTDTLPDSLRGFAESAAEHFLAPIDLPAVMAIGCVSAAIAQRVRINVGPNWFEPANMYLLAILPPSLHKSPVMKLATSALEEEERDLMKRWREDDDRRAIKREVVKHRIATIKRRKATAQTEQELTDAMADSAALDSPPKPMLLSDDATSEALIRRLQHGPLFMCSAEGRPFELMSGLYRSKGEDGADVYLKAWSEDPIRAARVTSGDVFIARPNLTMCLAIQPAVVDKLSRRDDFRGRGVIARFLCSFPVTHVGYREWANAQPLSDVATLNFNHSIRSLLALPRNETVPVVTLTTEARCAFQLFRQELEHAQRGEAQLAEWQDLGGKLAGHCARIALVLHMAQHGAVGAEHELSAPTMQAAVTLARYFMAHTIATWDGCAVEPKIARVVRWLASEEKAEVTTREIHRAHQRLYPRAQDARIDAAELAERGYLRSTTELDRWAVSPRLRCEKAERADKGDNHAFENATARTSTRMRVARPVVTPDDNDDNAVLSSLSPSVISEEVTAVRSKNVGVRGPAGTLSSLSSGSAAPHDKAAR